MHISSEVHLGGHWASERRKDACAGAGKVVPFALGVPHASCATILYLSLFFYCFLPETRVLTLCSLQNCCDYNRKIY